MSTDNDNLAIWILGDEGFWRTPDDRLQEYATMALMSKVRTLREDERMRRDVIRAHELPASGDLFSIGRANLLALQLAREHRASDDVQPAPTAPKHEDRKPVIVSSPDELDAVLDSLNGDVLDFHDTVVQPVNLPEPLQEIADRLAAQDQRVIMQHRLPGILREQAGEPRVTDSVMSGAPGPQGDVDVDVAARLAWTSHMGQTRRYTNAPYITHCENVAHLVQSWGGTPSMVAAAWLHDVLEDCDIGKAALREILVDEMSEGVGIAVWKMVCALTDVYTKESFPHLSRFERKNLEAERIAKCSVEVMVIKSADMADNTFDIERSDPKFAPVYLAEKARLQHLIDEHVRAWKEAR